jgi:hypothetical protein
MPDLSAFITVPSNAAGRAKEFPSAEIHELLDHRRNRMAP